MYKRNFRTWHAACRAMQGVIVEMQPNTNLWPIALALCDGKTWDAIELLKMFTARNVIRCTNTVDVAFSHFEWTGQTWDIGHCEDDVPLELTRIASA